MILPLLEEIAHKHKLVFMFGERTAFNLLADDLITDDSIVLYHQGYVGGPVIQDAQGLFEPSYLLRLHLLLPSELANLPVHRRPNFEKLEPLMLTILTTLSKTYILSNIFTEEGINLEDRALDGIRFTLNAKPKLTEYVYTC